MSAGEFDQATLSEMAASSRLRPDITLRKDLHKRKSVVGSSRFGVGWLAKKQTCGCSMSARIASARGLSRQSVALLGIPGAAYHPVTATILAEAAR